MYKSNSNNLIHNAKMQQKQRKNLLNINFLLLSTLLFNAATVTAALTVLQQQEHEQQQQNETKTTIMPNILNNSTLPNTTTTATTTNVQFASSLEHVSLPASASASSPVRQQRPQVRLNKCCHLGEYFDITSEMCVAGSTKNWVPLIFLIQPRRYYVPQGNAPKFITFITNSLPTYAAAANAASTSKTATEDDQSSTTANACSSMADLQLFSGSGKFVIFSNGSLFLRERGQLIEPRSYCVDRDAALVCFPKEQQLQQHSTLELKKCCGKYGSYDAAGKKCNYNGPTTLDDGKLHLTTLNESVYQTVYGLPECMDAHSTYAVAGDWQEAELDLATGALHLPHKNLTQYDYCLEHLQKLEQQADDATAIVAAPTPVKIITCSHHFAPLSDDGSLESAAQNNKRVRIAVLNVGIVISVVFLAATLIAGYMMPSVHHALHWRCQIYYVFCLFVGKFLLAYTQLTDSLEIGTGWCLLVASAMQFFFLSAFFWLNTMCFNIWWTFRDFRPSSLERNQELLRLRLYSAYAWGIPMIICAIAACVDQLPETQLARPGFGEHSCWFSGEHYAIFAYFFAPIGLLLCANIVLFISTTHQLTCGLWKRDDVKSTTEKTALGKVCLKLVVVMGVTWIADVISAVVGGPDSAWFVTDLINALQGVFIFIVVGCQPQVWTACKRLCCPRLRHDITNTTNGVQHSSSSQGLPSMGGCGTECTHNTSTTWSNVGNSATDSAGGLVVCSTTGANSQIPTSTASAVAAGPAEALTTISPTKSSKIPMETVC